MDWSQGDYFYEEYWISALHNLQQNSFINYEIKYPPINQIGVWIIERIDLVLKPRNHELLTYKKSILIDTIMFLAEHHTEMLVKHILRTIGVFTYSGLINMFDPDVLSMWKNIYFKYRYHTDEHKQTLFILSSWFITDKHLPDKIRFLRGINENHERYNNLDDRQITYLLEKDFTLIGADDPSAEVLYFLGILVSEDGDGYKPAKIEPNIVKAGELISQIDRVRGELNDQKDKCNFLKKIKDKFKLRLLNREYDIVISEVIESQRSKETALT